MTDDAAAPALCLTGLGWQTYAKTYAHSSEDQLRPPRRRRSSLPTTDNKKPAQGGFLCESAYGSRPVGDTMCIAVATSKRISDLRMVLEGFRKISFMGSAPRTVNIDLFRFALSRPSLSNYWLLSLTALHLDGGVVAIYHTCLIRVRTENTNRYCLIGCLAECCCCRIRKPTRSTGGSYPASPHFVKHNMRNCASPSNAQSHICVSLRRS